MGWKEDNKGAGPWVFAPQPNKWGYVNNPRWKSTPVAPINYDSGGEPQIWSPEQTNHDDAGSGEHFPCGHWHKQADSIDDEPEVIYDVNLYRMTKPWLDSGSIQSMFFNTTSKTLSLVGYYIGDDDLSALEILDNAYISTIKGSGANSKLLILDSALNVVSELSIFNALDIYDPTNNHLIYYNGYIYWFSVNGGVSTIGRITYPGYVRDGRFCPGGVYIGTDGNLYQYSYYSTSWGEATFRATTGALYAIVNEIIADGEHDGDTVAYGAGVYGFSRGTSTNSLHVRNGRIYIAIVASGSRTYCYSADNFSFIGSSAPSDDYARTVFRSTNGYVYTVGGLLTSFTVDRYDGDMNKVDHVHYAGYGRVMGEYCLCDLGSYIVIGTIEYGTSNFGIVLLNHDLTFVRFVSTKSLGFTGSQSIIVYDNFLFVGENTYVAVYELVGDDLIFLDRIFVDYGGADIGYVSGRIKYITVPR